MALEAVRGPASRRAWPMSPPTETSGEPPAPSPGHLRRQSGGLPPSARPSADQSSRGMRTALKSAPTFPPSRLLGAAAGASDRQPRADGASASEDAGDQGQDPREAIVLHRATAASRRSGDG